MGLIKKCPVCGNLNPPDVFICEECGSPIDDILPIDEDKLQAQEEKQEGGSLILVTDTGEEILVKDGDVLGREAKGAEFFTPYVSRKHARILCEDGKWWIKDMESTNGTYLNNKKISKKEMIRGDDIIQLSRSVKLKVKI